AAYCYVKAEYRKALSRPDASTFMGRMALRFMMQHHGEAQAAMIEALPGDLPRGSIVELGFGHGEGLKLLLDKYPHRPLIGLEISPSVVELVSAWPQAQGPSPRLRAAVGDPCAGLSLEEGSVALSFNMNCVYFWSDLEAGARELYRVAAPGGVAVTVTHPHHVRAMKGGPFQNVHLPPVIQALRKAGFEVAVRVLTTDGNLETLEVHEEKQKAPLASTAMLLATKPL
ncbi:unnamed protein product, partial [Symbiodinium sp. KB8]